MKLTLKIVVALAVLMAVGVAYAEVPDVSKWSCPDSHVSRFPDYGVETTYCDKSSEDSVYIKVSGELVYVYERITDAGKTVYYNALKTENGWIEVVNQRGFILMAKYVENKRAVVYYIVDNDNVVVATRFIPLLKK